MHFCCYSSCSSCYCCCRPTGFYFLYLNRLDFRCLTKVLSLIDVEWLAFHLIMHELVLHLVQCDAKILMHNPMGKSCFNRNGNIQLQIYFRSNWYNHLPFHAKHQLKVTRNDSEFFLSLNGGNYTISNILRCQRGDPSKIVFF